MQRPGWYVPPQMVRPNSAIARLIVERLDATCWENSLFKRPLV